MTASDRENAGRETVITFEDLDLPGRTMGSLPSGYQGFTWSDSAWFMPRRFGSSVCPGAVRGRVGLLNAHGSDIQIARTHAFDLTELSLCSLWVDEVQVIVEGWEKEVRKYVTTHTVSRRWTTHCTVEYRGIDRVEIKTRGRHLVITGITVLSQPGCIGVIDKAC